MNNWELQRQLQALQSLFQRTRIACNNDVELQSHWARYLCIICAGFLENSFKEIYIEFASHAASEPVANYTRAVLNRVSNPKASKFVETARAFKSIWGDELENFISDGGRREAIDSIMNNRHLIAHGRYPSSQITVGRLKDYFDKAVEVMCFIEKQCAS